MENSLNIFKSWIFNAAKNKKITINQMGWPTKFNLDVYDYTTLVVINGAEYAGYGTHADQDIAICKSVAEAYERYCVRSLKLNNSNGCAVHFNLSLAKQNALLELIERDCFLYKFIKKQSFKEISKTYHKLTLKPDTMLKNYILFDKEKFITLSRIVVNNESNILGLGIGQSLDQALEKSEIESIRQSSYIFDKEIISSVKYENILNKNILSFDDHGDIALTSEHYKEINFIFNQDSKLQTSDFNIFNLDDTKYTEGNINLDIKNPFYQIPLCFVKAENKNAQELFTGHTLQNINPTRIYLSNESDFNLCLHPFR